MRNATPKSAIRHRARAPLRIQALPVRSASPPDSAPPNEAAVVRLVGAILLEQNEGWSSVQRSRYMTLESVAPLSDDPTASLLILAS
jgi:hypothetical protein